MKVKTNKHAHTPCISCVLSLWLISIMFDKEAQRNGLSVSLQSIEKDNLINLIS